MNDDYFNTPDYKRVAAHLDLVNEEYDQRALAYIHKHGLKNNEAVNAVKWKSVFREEYTPGDVQYTMDGYIPKDSSLHKALDEGFENGLFMRKLLGDLYICQVVFTSVAKRYIQDLPSYSWHK
jgi:hypothetical protein